MSRSRQQKATYCSRKEVLHIIRDPRSLASALLTPLIMLLIFGYALSLDVDRISTIVYDRITRRRAANWFANFEDRDIFKSSKKRRATRPWRKRWTRAPRCWPL